MTAPEYNISRSWEPITATSWSLVTISGGITKPRAQPIYKHECKLVIHKTEATKQLPNTDDSYMQLINTKMTRKIWLLT